VIRIRANGKFLITGEYLVMAGAKALAVPLKLGQIMEIDESGNDAKLIWSADDPNGIWFQAEFSLPELDLLTSNNPAVAEELKRILLIIRKQNPDFLNSEKSFWVQNHLEFDRNWGMGSSSSLLVNLANWAHVNPFKLHTDCCIGSGYDIACAKSDQAILYEKHFDQTIIEPVKWHPKFRKNIAFVYLGEKQSTAKSIKNFHQLDFTDNDIREISQISEEFWLTNFAEDLMERMRDHEYYIGKIIKQTPVQNRLFKDFNGAIKSMGAWGGDFVMVLGHDKFNKIKEYFISKGFTTVLPWDVVL
jgi:mevalonate kinase